MRSIVFGARLAAIGGCVAGLLAVGVSPTGAQPNVMQTSQLTANDGTVFDLTNSVVRVPEQRTTGAAGGRTIELAVVRVRRAGSPDSSAAHVVLAGGPGDSGVNQVLGLARQGGAVFADLMNGDVIGIDQRGTGRSLPNLSSPALYGLPLDQPGSIGAAAKRRDRAGGVQHSGKRG
jgi:hypothetical protein